MFVHSTSLALIALLLCGCIRHASETREQLPVEPTQLASILEDAQHAGDALQQDVQGGRFWTAWRHSGQRVSIYGPLFDSHHNPILLRSAKSALWYHMNLSDGDFTKIRFESTQADSLDVAVIGRVEAINWYTKHVWIKAAMCDVVGAD
jgi:hypothetical protein